MFNGSKPQLNRVENRLFGFKNDKKRPINMVMVDQSYFIFTWKSLIPLWSKCDSHQGSEWSTLGAAIQEKALPRRRNRQHFGHCSIFFSEIARALKPETQVHGSDVFSCSLGRFHGPRCFVGFGCNLHFALDLDWKHVARWLLC